MSDAHLPFEQLADYVDGWLPAEVISRVEAHLAGCATCRQEAAWLRNVTSREVWATPPVRASAAVRRAFREQIRPTPSLREQLRALLRPGAGWAMAAAALIALIVGAFFFQSWRTTEVVQVARLASTEGTVEVLRAGEGIWRTASPGAELHAGDQLRTQPGATATLVHFEGSEVRLEAETELSLMRLSSRPDGENQTIIVRQTSGQTTHTVKPLPTATARYEVVTPNALVAVRGTVFTVRVGPGGGLDVGVSEGRVAVTTNGETVTVNAGAAFTVSPASVLTATPTDTMPPATAPAATTTAEATVTPTRPTSTVTPAPLATPFPTAIVSTATPAAPPTIAPTAMPPEPTPTPTPDDGDDDDDGGDDGGDDDG